MVLCVPSNSIVHLGWLDLPLMIKSNLIDRTEKKRKERKARTLLSETSSARSTEVIQKQILASLQLRTLTGELALPGDQGFGSLGH